MTEQFHLHFSLSCIGEGNGNPLQWSCLEKHRDGGAWWAAVHGVAKSQIWLSDFTCTFHFHALEKEMATHSSDLAWRSTGMGEPGGLPSMGSHRVRHDWSDLAIDQGCHNNLLIELEYSSYLILALFCLFVCLLKSNRNSTESCLGKKGMHWLK